MKDSMQMYKDSVSQVLLKIASIFFILERKEKSLSSFTSKRKVARIGNPIRIDMKE